MIGVLYGVTMAQITTITKRIVFGEFTDGADARPSGHHFIAIVDNCGDHSVQRNYIPKCWGYDDFLGHDEIKVGQLLDMIARENSLEDEDRIAGALAILRTSGKEGIQLTLKPEEWRTVENAPYMQMIGELSGKGFGVPHLERAR
jgi:hypothetical protein